MNDAAVISYTGLGRIKSVDISEWLRKCIRGESRTLNQTFDYIRQRADARLAKYAKSLNLYHIFNIGAIIDGEPWAVIISNIQRTPFDASTPAAEFSISAMRIEDKPLVIATGTTKAIASRDLNLLSSASQKRPRNPDDFQKLLAVINKRASEHPQHGKYISPSCYTSYIPSEGKPGGGRAHWWGQKPDRHLMQPTVFSGIDLTEQMQILARYVENLGERDADKIDNDEIDRALHAAGERSVIAED